MGAAARRDVRGRERQSNPEEEEMRNCTFCGVPFPDDEWLGDDEPFCPVCVLLMETGTPLFPCSPFDAVLEDIHRHIRAARGEDPAPNAGEEA
jgi:hypothetical protein